MYNNKNVTFMYLHFCSVLSSFEETEIWVISYLETLIKVERNSRSTNSFEKRRK